SAQLFINRFSSNTLMGKQAKHFYEFGAFCLDTVNRVLLRDGEVVPLNLPIQPSKYSKTRAGSHPSRTLHQLSGKRVRALVFT
ncbi:MAG TPA: hypothetical protein VGV87_25200, partial [Blastocatellia bacterium]|nr:hypothetical protein [Blastocatellia bacterium]